MDWFDTNGLPFGMPYRLAFRPSCFQKMMSSTFEGPGVQRYLQDITIALQEAQQLNMCADVPMCRAPAHWDGWAKTESLSATSEQRNCLSWVIRCQKKGYSQMQHMWLLSPKRLHLQELLERRGLMSHLGHRLADLLERTGWFPIWGLLLVELLIVVCYCTLSL